MELFNLFAKLVLDSSEFQAGVTEAQSGAEDLASSLDSTGESFDGLASAMIESGGVSSENLERLAELDAEYQKSQDEIKKLEDALDEMTASGDEASGGAQELSDMLDAEREHAAQLQQEMMSLVNANEEQTDSTKDASQASEQAGSALSKYEGAIKKIKSAIQGLVAYKVAKWFWDTTDAVAEYGDHIDKTSQKMNLSAEAYQQWSFIAEHSGTSIDGLKMSMKTLAVQAENNSDAFNKLGMSYDDINKMSQEELFENTIKALQGVKDTTERTAIATQLLGRGAMELGPLFNSSASDIDDMKDRLNDLGGVMSERLVKNSAAYEDAMTDLQAAVQGAKNNIADFFMEFNTDVITAAANALGYLNRAFDDLFPDTYEEELEQNKRKVEALEKSYERFAEAGDELSMEAVASQLDIARAKVEELEGKINSATDTFETHENELAELKAAYDETFSAVSESLEGWFGAFDNASYEVTTSADEMMENLQSQADFWSEYSQNLQTLSDAGFDSLVTAIEGMGPAGAQYLNVLSSMVNGSEEEQAKLEDIASKFEEVEQQRNEASDTVTAIQFKDNSDETLRHIADVKKMLSDLDGSTATVTIITEDGPQGVDGENAAGLDYVPYHNFHAILHEGEAVLNKSEATAWRNGESFMQSADPNVAVIVDLLQDIISNGLNANVSTRSLYRSMRQENKTRTTATNYNAFAMA